MSLRSDRSGTGGRRWEGTARDRARQEQGRECRVGQELQALWMIEVKCQMGPDEH